MLKRLLVLTILLFASTVAWADARSDCGQWQTMEADRLIVACAEVIGRGEGDVGWAYSNRGIGFYKKGDYPRAISDYTTAIKLGAKANRYDNRGLAYYHSHDYDRAIADYTMALKIDPRFAASYHNRGLAYREGKGDYNRAISDFSKVIELEPRDVGAYVARGNTWERMGNKQKAVADFRQALVISPAHEGAKNSLQRLGVA
jgi:tetratricopeptide (TPR) repeat protein